MSSSEYSLSFLEMTRWRIPIPHLPVSVPTLSPYARRVLIAVGATLLFTEGCLWCAHSRFSLLRRSTRAVKRRWVVLKRHAHAIGRHIASPTLIIKRLFGRGAGVRGPPLTIKLRSRRTNGFLAEIDVPADCTVAQLRSTIRDAPEMAVWPERMFSRWYVYDEEGDAFKEIITQSTYRGQQGGADNLVDTLQLSQIGLFDNGVVQLETDANIAHRVSPSAAASPPIHASTDANRTDEHSATTAAAMPIATPLAAFEAAVVADQRSEQRVKVLTATLNTMQQRQQAAEARIQTLEEEIKSIKRLLSL